ncbi:aldo/keto reductase [Mucilaginibacter litoreus]|uniref:Aldo/keto reductase n=1 Tax=Mucilaginibacter litoreus TaxID=1048221 RepID=A0ABW3AX05_9SPHI
MKYQLFGKHTGLPVSQIILGAANFGARKGYGASAEEIPAILGTYADAGGNFIDISDRYQLGEAEEKVGEFIKSQRNNFVVCSKYTRSSESDPKPANLGNHRKSMQQAVDGSLRRLQTDYIDIYMPHYDDGLTPLEEIARGLEDLVKAGKVLYTGLANFPAWKASMVAQMVPLAALQIEYNLTQRTAERELLPMAGHLGIGTMFYSPLAGGLLTGKYRHGETGRLLRSRDDVVREDETTHGILNKLETIATETHSTSGQVALAWTFDRGGFPIIGARKINHLSEALNALELKLTDEHISELNVLSEISLGYPHDLLKTVQISY